MTNAKFSITRLYGRTKMGFPTPLHEWIPTAARPVRYSSSQILPRRAGEYATRTYPIAHGQPVAGSPLAVSRWQSAAILVMPTSRFWTGAPGSPR